MKNNFGIFFDLDGTLVDNEHLKAVAFSEGIKSFGGDSDPAIYKEVMGMDGLSIRRHFAAKAKLPVDFDEYFKIFKSIYETLLLTELSVRTGAVQFLAEIKSKDIKMALISSAYSASVDFIIDSLKLREYFTFILSGDNIQKKKPDPECYLLALDKLKLPKEKVIVFEDTESGLKAAFGAGIKSIGIRHEYNQSHDFSRASFEYASYENDIKDIRKDINLIFGQTVL